MGAILVSDKASIPEIEDGDYVAKLVDHDKSISKFDNKPQFALTYEIVEGEYEGIRLKRWINRKEDADGNMTAHPKSTIYKELAALNGRKDLQIGDSFDLDDLIDNTVILTVRNKEGQDGQDRPKITDVRAVRSRKAKAATARFDEDDLPFD